MNRILNVGVIGVEAIGKHQLRSYTSNPKAKVVAIADINEELARTVAEDYSVKFFKEYQDISLKRGS
jgi:UDP-N-acetylglucosamine 3-dehydrogenase